ncbi:MAG TPA: LON peptidase substrate-binding domain-containing protein [Burkholderiales bacterium]|nr:LON peptidase substrate-binding domain-containing protein [Burkholderiales bacterium]
MAGARAPPRPDQGIAIENLPLFPLRAVLFPGGRLPLRIFEARYMDMARACLREDAPFGVCAIREGAEVGAPATPYEVGTLARIVQWDMPQLGVLQVVAHGERRFRIRSRQVQRDGLARAAVELLGEESDAPVAPAGKRCVRLLERLIEREPDLFAEPHRLDSSAWVSARLAELLPLELGAKQALLELDAGAARLEEISALLRADAPPES